MTPQPTPGGSRSSWWRSLFDSDLAGSWVLVAAVAVALLWANSPWSASYQTVWLHPVHVAESTFSDLSTVRDWVNGGLMAVFFLVVGLEIGRERRVGELGDLRTAVVPVAGALGGMAATGLVYVAFNHGGPGSHGWGIPMATDIAFALGALALLGRRVPSGLRLLLLTLAVADDIGSVLVLAIFYSHQTRVPALLGAVAVVGVMVLVRHRWSGAAWPILVGGVVLWVLLAAGGVEPALAGVVAGVLVPGRPPHPHASGDGPSTSPLSGPLSVDVAGRLERRVAPVSAFIVLPLFAVANAGISLHAGMLRPAGASSVFAGIATARIVGKLVGITLACAVVVRLGLGRLPTGVRWGHVAGGAAVAGIGFTVPLLIAEQAFVHNTPLVEASELGLLAGSAVAFMVGALILVAVGRRGTGAGGDTGAVDPDAGGDGDAFIPW